MSDVRRLTITTAAENSSAVIDAIRAQFADSISDDTSVTVSGSTAVIEVTTTEPHAIASMSIVRALDATVNMSTVP